jgi:hypothetical protein
MSAKKSKFDGRTVDAARLRDFIKGTQDDEEQARNTHLRDIGGTLAAVGAWNVYRRIAGKRGR